MPAMSYIRQDDGVVDNVRLRNVQIRAWDRYPELDSKHLDMRGHYIFSVQNATNVVLDNVRIQGDFAQKAGRTQFSGCNDSVIKDCAFD